MKVWLIKDSYNRLHPFGDHDREKVEKMKEGDPYLFERESVRNHMFHRKYFAMMRLAYENQDEITDEYRFRKLMEMRAGYFEFVKTDKGEMWWPKSISYEKLEQEDFEQLYDKVWQVLQDRYGFDEDFINELANFA